MKDNEINFEGKLGKSSTVLPIGIKVDHKDNLLHFSGENKALLGTIYANVKSSIFYLLTVFYSNFMWSCQRATQQTGAAVRNFTFTTTPYK